MATIYLKSLLLGMSLFLLPANGYVRLTASYINETVITIEFKENHFGNFYKCLCSLETSSCIAGYTTDKYTILTKAESSINQIASSVYECIIDNGFRRITCSKQQKSNIMGKYQHFYNSNGMETESCNVTCIGITGTSDYSLRLHNDSRIVNCESDISDITSTEAAISTTTVKAQTAEIISDITGTVTSTNVGPQTSEITATDATTTSTVKRETGETTSQTNTKLFTQDVIIESTAITDKYQHTVETTTNQTAPFTEEDKDSNDDEVVIGVVVTLSIVIIFIALGFFVWRKKKLKRKSNENHYQASNIGISSDAIAMGTHVNTIDSHGEETQQNGQASNPYIFFDEDSEFSSNEDEESLPPNSNEYRNVQPMNSDTYSNINTDTPNVNPLPTSPYSEVAESSDVDNTTGRVQGDSNYEPVNNNQSSATTNSNDATTMSSPYSLAASITAIGNTMDDKDTSSAKKHKPNVTDIYSKLHDKVKDMKNPYDALLDSEERSSPQKEATLPDVVKSSKPTNETVEYTLAQPVNFVSTNEYAGIDYDVKPYGREPTSSLVIENDSENTIGQSSDLSDVRNDDSSTNPYFELEKIEDTDECDT